jgi:nitronate monooxygenase
VIHTGLTERFNLRYPIVGAPMWGAGGGKLARAITVAGGLGMIGVGSEAPASYIERESEIARGADDGQFGLALMVWAIEQRPELLDAAIAARPAVLSLSFGSPEPYVARVRAEGILVAAQVASVQVAREVEAAGVDFIVAQGTEAGGHTGHVSTLPLLQAVLDEVHVPVLAAGGIATARGLAAVLAAGAAGAWIGTAFLACPECSNTEEARRRILAAQETDTLLTSLFDRVQRLAWPPHYPGRALRNRFAEHWHDRVDELAGDEMAAEEYREARATREYDVAVIYAGQAAGLVRVERPAGDVVREIGEGAETILRGIGAALLTRSDEHE